MCGGIHNARNGRPRAPDGASGHRAHGEQRTQDAEVNAHSRGAAGCCRAPTRNCRRAPRGRLRVASRSRGRTAHEPRDVQSWMEEVVRSRGYRTHPVVEPSQFVANHLRDGAAHALGPHGNAHGTLPAGRVGATLYSSLP